MTIIHDYPYPPWAGQPKPTHTDIRSFLLAVILSIIDSVAVHALLDFIACFESAAASFSASLPVLLVIVLFCGYLDYLALVSYCLYG